MNNTYKTITLILGIILTLLVLVGFSYAYFVSSVLNNESSGTISSNAASLSLTFDNGSGDVVGENLAIGWNTTKTFTVTNTGTDAINYDLVVYGITNTLAVKEGITISYTSTNGGGTLTERALPLTTETLSANVLINVGVTQTYTLSVKYKNLAVDQTGDLGKNFKFKIGIKDPNEEKVYDEE